MRSFALSRYYPVKNVFISSTCTITIKLGLFINFSDQIRPNFLRARVFKDKELPGDKTGMLHTS